MAQAAPFSINRRISSTRHAVVRGPSLTGFGKRPSLMPAHQVDFDTGIGPRGANIDARRTKPVSGRVSCCATVYLHAIVRGVVLGGSTRAVAEFGYRTGDFGYPPVFFSMAARTTSCASRSRSRIVCSSMRNPRRSTAPLTFPVA